MSTGTSKAPVKPPVIQPGSGNAIIINPCQRLNPVLECIKNVSKEFGDIVPDFQLGRTTCALFLSLKYHRLHPEYIHQRIQKLGNSYNLRILLLMCDIDQHQDPIRELTKICLINNMTVIVCWSAEEAGTYLATYKAFEHKSADLIKERIDKDYHSILRASLTSVNKVNKMDVETLRAAFGSFAGISRATPEQLRSLPGFGEVKVRRIKDAFEKPFRNKATSSVAELRASVNTGLTDEEIFSIVKRDEKGKGRATEVMSTPNHTPTSSPTKGKTPHRFGSAAEMPPPPVPRVSPSIVHDSSVGLAPASRYESSPWDIELDLNGTELDEQTSLGVDAVLTKAKGVLNAANANVETNSVTERRDTLEGRLVAKAPRPPRSPSPVWDIELDLNDD